MPCRMLVQSTVLLQLAVSCGVTGQDRSKILEPHDKEYLTALEDMDFEFMMSLFECF